MPRRSAADLDTPPVRLVESPVIPAELPPAPDHLSPAMQAWWQAVVRDQELDPHHLRLLEAAADAWDRMVQARETLAREGLTVTTKSGTKRHPCADIERDSRIAFARLVRELDLDCEPPLIREIVWPLQGHHPDFVFTYVAQRTRDGRVQGERYPLTYSGVKTAWRRLRKRAAHGGTPGPEYDEVAGWLTASEIFGITLNEFHHQCENEGTGRTGVSKLRNRRATRPPRDEH